MKRSIALRFLIFTFALVLMFQLSCLSAIASSYYQEDLNETFYFNDYEPSQYYPNDYAYTFVSEYGGWDDGFPIPTDFYAETYVEGVRFMLAHTKIAHVEVSFYDSEGYYSSANDSVEVPHQATSVVPTGSAIVYGEGNCNEEYGLCEVTCKHYVECRAPETNGQMVQWRLTPTIVIDTTGFLR